MAWRSRMGTTTLQIACITCLLLVEVMRDDDENPSVGLRRTEKMSGLNTSPFRPVQSGPHTPGLISSSPVAVTRDALGGASHGGWFLRTWPSLSNLDPQHAVNRCLMTDVVLSKAWKNGRSPRGYAAGGPYAPCLRQHVEHTGHISSGSWDLSLGACACSPWAMARCRSDPNIGIDDYLCAAEVWRSDSGFKRYKSDTSCLYRHVVEQCLTHVLLDRATAKRGLWFLPVLPWFKHKRCIMYRMWTCLGNLKICMFLTIALRFLLFFLQRCLVKSYQLMLDGVSIRWCQPSAFFQAHLHSQTYRCRPSPKSGGSGTRGATMHWLLRYILFLYLLLVPAAGVRVTAESTAAVGAHSQTMNNIPTGWAKSCGVDAIFRPQFSYSRKRAYKRAVHRAEQHGYTTYKGRLHSLKQLANLNGVSSSQRPKFGKRDQHISSTPNSNQYIQILSWNVGGLTNSVLDELQLWLEKEENQQIQVVMLQETRWNFTSEWSNARWAFLHAGHPSHKGSGVLTMVSTKLCSPRQLRSCEVQAGRILHTRIPRLHDGTSIDIVNVYQYPWDFQASQIELVHKRYSLLQNVEKIVKAVPLRNLCVCGGDMNVQLHHLPGLVGTATTLGETDKQTASDAEALTELLTSRQMVALNTWSGPRRSVYTFELQRPEKQIRTQIDYLFARRHQVTNLMRKCKVVADFPVTAWRASGLHRPLLLCTDYRWRPLSKGQGLPGRVDEDALKKEMRQGTARFHCLQADLHTALDALPELDMDAINAILQECGHRHYPKTLQHNIAPYRSAMVTKVVNTRWQHLAAMRKHSSFGVTQLFQFWKHLSRFRALRREANKASRLARRSRIDDLLKEAERHARDQNMHRLYKIVRQLAPKQPYKKVQIYDAAGQMLSTAQEAAEIHSHFSAIFQGGSVVQPWECSTGVKLFSFEDVWKAMRSIPANKATPPHMAPGVTWKAAAWGLAGVLHRGTSAAVVA